MKIIKFVLIFIIYQYAVSSDAAMINYLDSYFFGFEDGGSAFYIQHGDYWSISGSKAANGSSFSLKFNSDQVLTADDGDVKVHGNGSLISFPAGDYTFKFKVWLAAGSDISAFQFVIKEPWTALDVELGEVPDEQWTEVSVDYTFSDEVKDAKSMFVMAPSYGGKGTLYIDVVEIWGVGDEETVPVELPSISAIQTQNDGSVSLPAGIYALKMHVFVEDNTSINKFYTQLVQPISSHEWSLEGVARNEWVELEQEITLNADADNSAFRIFINNNPKYGGGKGKFYIDDLEFNYKKELGVEDRYRLDLKVFPNPATDFLYVVSEKPCAYKLYNVYGELVKNSTRMRREFNIPVAGLTPGIFLIKFQSEGGSVVKKVFVR